METSVEPVKARVLSTGRMVAVYYDRILSLYVAVGTNDKFKPEDIEVLGECETPYHYDYAIEPIDFIEKNKLGFCEGNVIKYVSRHERKNGAEDIRKAMVYLRFILRYKYGEETQIPE